MAFRIRMASGSWGQRKHKDLHRAWQGDAEGCTASRAACRQACSKQLWPASEAAQGCVQDAAEGKRIVEYLLRYLDRGHHWTNASGLVEVALGTMRKVGF